MARPPLRGVREGMSSSERACREQRRRQAAAVLDASLGGRPSMGSAPAWDAEAVKRPPGLHGVAATSLAIRGGPLASSARREHRASAIDGDGTRPSGSTTRGAALSASRSSTCQSVWRRSPRARAAPTPPSRWSSRPTRRRGQTQRFERHEASPAGAGRQSGLSG